MNSGVSFDCTTLRPYLGIPPHGIEDLHSPFLPPYVLLIENLASFNRHVAEVEDDGLVLYTAGFPSSAMLRLFRLLDEKLPENVPFFHWGDLDLGGLRIMGRIQQHLRRALHPHLMTRELLEQHGESASRINTMKLTALAARHHNLKPLVDLVLSFDPPLWLEQENVDPRAPAV